MKCGCGLNPCERTYSKWNVVWVLWVNVSSFPLSLPHVYFLGCGVRNRIPSWCGERNPALTHIPSPNLRRLVCGGCFFCILSNILALSPCVHTILCVITLFLFWQAYFYFSVIFMVVLVPLFVFAVINLDSLADSACERYAYEFWKSVSRLITS